MRIALIGRSQSTKTWASRYLSEKHGFDEWPLTDGVLRILRMMYPHDRFKRVPWEMRVKVYDALYNIDSDIWITFFKKRLEDHRTKAGKRIIVDDVRYINEVKALKEMGFTIVEITGTPKSIQQLKQVAPSDLILTLWYRDAHQFLDIDYSMDVTGYIRGESKHLDKLVENLTTA